MRAALLAAAVVFTSPAAAVDALEFAKEHHRLRDFQSMCTTGQLPDGELAEARDVTTACSEVASLVKALRTEGFCTAPVNAEDQSSIGWVKCPDPEMPYADALDAFRRGEYAKALKSLRQFAALGHVGAQYNIGVAYANGEGVPQDSTKAVMWFRRAAERDFAEAQDYLGFMYEKGFGVPKDFAQAVTWYRRAGEQGFLNAQNKLGVMYDSGKGVPQHYAEAVKWYRLAADQGDADAQYNLGVMYGRGRGVPQDYVEAVKWYRLAADQGDAIAQTDLGNMYFSGQGVPQDYVEAVKWWRLAADQGNAIAQTGVVALMFSSHAEAHTVWMDIGCGVGLISDGAKFRHITSAGSRTGCELTATTLNCADGTVHKMEILPDANGIVLDGVRLKVVGPENPAICHYIQGDAIAQTNLGNMYHEGKGVPQDYVEAVKWWRLAADQGNASTKRDSACRKTSFRL